MKRLVLLQILLLCVLSSCGQKGPLRHPSQPDVIEMEHQNQ
ncbi:MAG: lipoprotein [Candidatus Thiodiazotropha sp.]